MPQSPSCERCTAALLFIDISGFTPLSARLGALGASAQLKTTQISPLHIYTHPTAHVFPPFAKTVGIERLSRILNDYFSSQIALVSNHGGDIIKFAGDALMAMWEENMADTRPLACLRAAQCALELQEKLGGSRTGELGRSSSETRMSVEVASDGTDNSQSEVLNIKISLGYGQVSAFHVSSSEGGANPYL